MRIATRIAALALFALLAASAQAEPTVTTVLDGLNNPCGVVLQPGTGHLFVSDSGAGRVIRIVDGKAEDVIVDFPIGEYGKGPVYKISPLGLSFLDQNTLVVGGGGLPDGEEMLRVYTVPAAGSPAIKAADMEQNFKLAPTDQIKGEGNFYALAATPQAVYVTANGDDTKGWVARAPVKKNRLTGFERFIATKEATDVDAPVGATISLRGELVIGQMGEINVPRDSLLTFYNAKNGEMLLNLETGLFDITAVAYGQDRQLYATDFAWMETSEGGLFQLIATNEGGEQGVEAKRVLTLDKPTAMAFDKEGTLYVTVIGTADEGSDAHPGKLLKIKL